MKQNLLLWTHENYPFLRRLRLQSGAESCVLPPLLQMSAALSLRCLQTSENRLLLATPFRDQCAHWIALCCALQTMRIEYSKVLSQFNFMRGQKVRVNGNCIAYFDRVDENDFVWLRWKDHALWSFAPSKTLHLQPVSETQNVTTEARAVEKLERTKSSATISALDNLLDIRSRGNLGLFENNVALVSEIGVTRDFSAAHFIGDERLKDVLLWGRVSDGGAHKPLHEGSINALSTLVVAGNVHGASAWSENQSERCRAIVFDGARRATQSLGALDDRVLDRRVPVIVVCDEQGKDDWEPLLERGFRLWHWKPEMIAPSVAAPQDKSVFAFWRQRVENFRRHDLIAHAIAPSVLDEVAAALFVFERALGDEHTAWRVLAGEVYKHLNTQAREVFAPDAASLATIQGRTQTLCTQVEAPDMWLPPSVLEAKNRLAESLRLWCEADAQNAKCDVLRAVFGEEDGDIIVVCADAEAAKNARRFWSEERRRNRAPRRSMTFLSVDEVLHQRFCHPEIVVSGWLGGRRMSELLRAPFASRVHILLHPFEARWFEGARRRWKQTPSSEYSMGEWGAWLGTSGRELQVPSGGQTEAHFEKGNPQGTMVFDEKPADEIEALSDADDILSFEVRVRQTKYAVSRSTSSADETERARLTIFRDGRWAFFSEFHRVWRATEIVHRMGKAIPRQRIADLESGDWVIFRQSGRDAIREIADRNLKRQHPDARRLSGLWREALRRRLRATDGHLKTLAAELRSGGFERHYTTLRGWVFDDDIIGPLDANDLLHIAVATGDRELESAFEEVGAAIKVVRGAHLQAADAIQERLMRDLPNLVKDRVLDSGAIELDLPEIGRAELLLIEEISGDWQECAVRECNRLLS